MVRLGSSSGTAAAREFGMLMPSGNMTAEPDLGALMPDDVSLHVTRLRLNGSSRENLLAMIDGIDAAASLLADIAPNVIAFHCTAVSTFSAELEADIVRRIEAASGHPAVATSAAIVAALHRLGARRVALVTPYIDEINQREIAFLQRHGFECVANFGAGLFTPREMYDVEPQEWLQLARTHVPPQADCLFMSCTAIRALPMIAACEAALGIPLVTSNQAMGWYLRHRLGVRGGLAGGGRLLSEH